MRGERSVNQVFQCRAEEIQQQGFGLSVDVYSPNLFELMSRFERASTRPAYLEIFRAAAAALETVTRRMTGVSFAYHGEGLWITQPDFARAPHLRDELDDVISQLHILASPWLNHECATKQMAGYSFGTYLPPLYTAESARVVADNIEIVQAKMDERRSPGQNFGPLFLLEMPPLTYFMAGTLAVPTYFRLVADSTSCGFVLDIGHLWTVYRYSTACREMNLEAFVERFLDEFPLERVIEVHVAGLAPHEASVSRGHSDRGHPEWIDAHVAPVPDVSWMVLEQVLAHPRLCNLRGIALEVDNKPMEQIVNEFQYAHRRFSSAIDRCLSNHLLAPDTRGPANAGGTAPVACEVDREQLVAEYAQYAQIVSGRQPPTGPNWEEVAVDTVGLSRYIHEYLPHEILHWGGDITDMFPETSRRLNETGLPLSQFVTWWFHTPRPVDQPYDFFLLKIDLLVEFVSERAPALLSLTRQEADALRSAYIDANAHADLEALAESQR